MSSCLLRGLRRGLAGICTDLCCLNQRDPANPADGSYERALASRYRSNCMGLLRRARQIEMEGVSDTFCAALMMFFVGEVSNTISIALHAICMKREKAMGGGLDASTCRRI